MSSLKLTVATVAGKPPLIVSIRPEQIVALAPSPSGGSVVRIPTREITVTETINQILDQWLGPDSGDPSRAETVAAAGD